MKSKAIGCALLALAALTPMSYAIEPHHEYRRLVESAQHMTALKSDLFGDSISLYNGKTEFVATDVDIPGNSSLSVRVQRRFNVELRVAGPGTGYDDSLGGAGGWSIDVPYISGMFASVGTWANNRCSGEMVPGYPTSFKLTDIWQGNVIHTPGDGDRVMLRAEADTPMPADGIIRRWSTAQRDAIDCTPMRSGLAGEGYRVKTTSGDTYYFDAAVTRYAGSMTKPRGSTLLPAKSNRVRIYLLATKVQDHLGNEVNYQYNSNGHPVRIWANDGREIVLTYQGQHLQSVSANGRRWLYQYGSVEGEIRLSSVQQPDGSQWKMEYSSALNPSAPDWDGNSTSNCAEQPPAVPAQFRLSLTHPSGATGNFNFSNRRHYRSGVHVSACLKRISGSTFYYELATPNFFDVVSISRKEISGPGIAEPMRWSYAYGGGAPGLWGRVGSAPAYPCTTCPEQKTVKVTNPDGSATEYQYGYQYSRNEGRPLGSRVLAADGTLLRTEATVYLSDEDASKQLFSPRYGIINSGDDPSTARVRPVVRSTVEQDGVLYLNQVASGCNGGEGYCFDSLAYPTASSVSNSTGYSRTDTTEYRHDTSAWLLGQVAATTNQETGLQTSRVAYDSRGLPSEKWRFEALSWRRTYHPDGSIASITDANSNATRLTEWKSGVPQRITFADGNVITSTVDGNGWVKAIRNQSGALTKFEHDALGRTTRVDHSQSDQQTWNPTVQAFEQVSSSEYGLEAGHWRRTSSTGNARSYTYYDALWRPILVRELDAGDVGKTERFRRSAYDFEGRPVFHSYPARQPTITRGHWVEYDALGRTTATAEDSERGLITTTTDYLRGGSIRRTSPSGLQTVTAHWLAGDATYDAVSSIQQPEGVTTEIVRDLFGKPLTITRRNADRTQSLTRGYAYDRHQRLCKSVEPETGATVRSYDAAGNLISASSGVEAGGISTCGVGEGADRRVTRSYDSLNRLAVLTFPDGRGDQLWRYTPDGEVSSITTSSGGLQVVNEYAYNSRGLLTKESLRHTNGENWELKFSYDKNAAPSGISYPSGAVVDFAPNALGQATRAGEYASDIRYNADGSMASLRYGNGIESKVERDERSMPRLTMDSGPGRLILHDTYSYDLEGNTLAIVDGTPGGENTRRMQYDRLNRLSRAESRSFGGDGVVNYRYDALDNISAVLQPGQRMHYYIYDAANRLTNVRNEADGTVIGLTYDAQGNLAAKNGQLFFFDVGNRLRESESKERYEYDGYGRRSEAVSPTVGVIRSMYGKDGTLRHQRNEREARSYDYVSVNGRLLARLSEDSLAAAPVLTVPGHTTNGSYPVKWTSMTGASSYELQELPTEGDWVATYKGAGLIVEMQGKPVGHYTYRVRSCNGVGCGAWSATTAIFVRQPATPPFGITVPELGMEGRYSVAWLAPRPRSISATVYELEESAGSSSWVQVYRGDALSWATDGKAAGVYSYRVRACNPDGCSAYAMGGSVTVIHPPAAPGLSGPAESLNGSYTMYWSSVPNATSYQLDESINDGQWSRVHSSSALTTALSGRKTALYRYRIQACNRGLCGAFSPEHSVNSVIPPEHAPEHISISEHGFAGDFTLYWTGVPTADFYRVHENLNGGGFVTAADVVGGHLRRSGRTTGTWGYRISACNRAGCGALGPLATTYVLLPPGMPNITSSYQMRTSRPPVKVTCSVQWTPVAHVERYELYAWANGQLYQHQYNGPDDRVFDRQNGRYCAPHHVVRACNAAGCSEFSPAVAQPVQIIPTGPGGIVP